MSTKKVVIIAASVVSALLVAVVIVGVILLNTINAQAENDRYQRCMEAQGFTASSGLGVTSDDELDGYIDSLVDAAEFCTR